MFIFFNQNPLKLQPDFDKAIANILRRDSQGVVVVAGWNRPSILRLLQERWQNSCADVFGRIITLPWLSADDYLSATECADVVLDSFPMGAGTSTWELLSAAAPAVTWPSQFSRGRFVAAAYRRMGLEDLVATSCDDYVDLAVHLGLDRDRQRWMRKEIEERGRLLFEDRSVVTELESFFLRVCSK